MPRDEGFAHNIKRIHLYKVRYIILGEHNALSFTNELPMEMGTNLLGDE